MNDSGWWFSFLTASPLPETGEAVNVGIVIGNGRVDQIAFAHGLPRLSGLINQSERRVFEDILSALKEQVPEGIGLAELKASIGPQIRVGERRTLLHSPDKGVVDLMIRRYLTSPASRDVRAVEKLVKESRRRLDGALSSVADLAMKHIEHSVSAPMLYPGVAQFRGVSVPRLGRAVRGEARDLLIDAVLLVPGKTTLAVRSATERIGKAFWYYDRARDEVLSEEHRDLRLVGYMIAEDPDSREVRDMGDYIEEGWRPHATVIRAANGDGLALLRGQIAWLAEGG